MKRVAPVVMCLALGACVQPWQQGVGVGAVASRPAAPVVGACPAPLVQQARWLMNNVARVRLGTTKLETLAILGQPARAESFLLTDGQMVEVLFYHTLSTVCVRPDMDGGLMPFVFQSGRLMGYGQSYYQNFLVPFLRAPMTGMPATTPVSAPVATSFPQPLARGLAGRPTMLQEDLPQPEAPGGQVGRGAPLAP